MTIDYQQLRIDGIYKQNDQGQLMLRVKIPAGVLSSEQAIKIADLAESYAGDRLHLTCRGSIELHDLEYEDLQAVTRGLASVGLTSRGACGGAVRGISCSSTFGDNFIVAQALARKLHRHFAGNPHFEGLPKKFKISVDGDYRSSRHLIQDIGLVFVGSDGPEKLFDIWMAGGLGREPQAGFRYASQIAESQLIPTIEATIRIYKERAEKGKRLKHLINQIGEPEFRRLMEEHPDHGSERQVDNGLGAALGIVPGAEPVTFPVFAGELTGRALSSLAALAARYAGGSLALSADQDTVFFPVDKGSAEQLKLELSGPGLGLDSSGPSVRFRVCPGNHECRMGLAATRDVAKKIIATLPADKSDATWAISGCPNSCSQPQLADFGIVSRKLVKDDQGNRTPRFDLLQRGGDDLGQAIATGLDPEQLLEKIRALG